MNFIFQLDKAMSGGRKSRGTEILLVMADQDGDGMISFKEYCALMNVD